MRFPLKAGKVTTGLPHSAGMELRSGGLRKGAR